MRSNPKSDAQTTPKTPSIARRTVLGAAWAAPVILAAVAAPAAAASPSPPTSPLHITFDNFTFSRRSTEDPTAEANWQVDFPYVDWQLTKFIASATVYLYLPKAFYTGSYAFKTVNSGDNTNWTFSSVTSSGDSWVLKFNYNASIFQGNSSTQLRISLTKVTPVVAGTYDVNGVAQAIDSDGKFTPMVSHLA